MKRHLLALTALLAVTATAAECPLAARWTMGQNNAEPGYYSSRLVITNVSPLPLGNDWTLFFNQFSRSLRLAPTLPVDIDEVSTTYYRVRPNARYSTLAPGDSLVIDLLMRGTMVNAWYAPQGGHVVLGGDLSRPLPCPIAIDRLESKGQWIDRKDYPDGPRVFDLNAAVNAVEDGYTGNDYDIFPTPKEVNIADGFTAVGTLVTVKGGKSLLGKRLKAARALLVENLHRRGIYVTGGQSTVIELKHKKNLDSNPEYYELTVDNGRITITAGSDAGAMNGVKTLIAALDHSHGHRLQNAVVRDRPDFNYRGVMLDIARNFFDAGKLRRFIDLLAYYKLNTFQFHFTDDEGWRLEIPGLPELTDIASRRGCTLDEKHFLAQIFDGNGDPDDLSQSANGYLTRAEFVSLLRYAHERGVRVIPEIETPGHARAAIIAMRNRHARLTAEGNTAEAERYRLWDDDDKSEYYSAQAYTDDVLNVAQDGVYRFVDKVVSELELMYREAGLRLDIVHLGGDEVAKGAWDKSPAVQALMQREHLADQHAVHEYYLDRISSLLAARGISIEGWQEVGLGHSDQLSERLRPRIAGLNAWSTVGRNATVPYRLANDGYPVILSNVTNFYLDMGYNWHQYEQGLHWGGAVDEFAAWDAQPWDIYRTSRVNYDGTPTDLVHAADGKPALERPENIIGVQGQIWGETLRNFGQVQRMMLPKMFGLVERAWNSRPEWGGQYSDLTAYNEARHQYNLKIGTRELPLVHHWGFNLRVGQPGIKVEGNTLLMNAPYPGVAVRYTLDGSEPDVNSPQWTAPVVLKSVPPVIKARAYYLGHESVTTYWWK